MMKSRMIVSALVIATCVSACAVEGDEFDTASNGGTTELDSLDDSTPAQETELLHNLSVGQQEVVFFGAQGAEGQMAFALRTTMDARLGQAPAVEVLREQHGELTTLEVFLALADAGEEADPRLVDAHAAEAQSLGRDSAAVRQVSYTAPEVEKVGVSSCDNSFFGGFISQDPQTGREYGYHGPPASSGLRSNTSGTVDICMPRGNCSQTYRTTQTVGACSDEAMTIRPMRRVEGDVWRYYGPEHVTGTNSATWWTVLRAGPDGQHMALRAYNTSSTNTYVLRGHERRAKCKPGLACFNGSYTNDEIIN